MSYDSVTQKVVLFGGFNGTFYLGDTWLWDGSTLRVDAGHAEPITLLLLPVPCYFLILMAGPIFLADTTATSISLPCGDGTAPIGRS